MNQRFAFLMEPDLRALGWERDREVALLATAAVAEVALVERGLGRVAPGLQAALASLLRINHG
jgi:hypothetical protein